MEFAYSQTNGKITRLLAIQLPVVDVETSVNWYKEHLGLTLLQVTDVNAELAVVEDGVAVPPTLILTKTVSNYRFNYNKNGRLCSMIMMHASNLVGIRDRMLKAGAKVTMPHADQEEDGCGRFFEATDPSGNIIQVQANDEETPAEHSRVEAIFNLEIPVSNVRKSARFYSQLLGFNLIREPDDQLAIVKTGPFYKHRFGYYNVQEFGFFLFHHGGKKFLQFEDISGKVQECLVLQADDVGALYKRLSEQGGLILEPTINDVEQFSFHVVDPDGNRIRVLPKKYEYTYGQTSVAFSKA